MTNAATKLEEEKQSAKTELDNARQNVVELLQEPPSTNLFVRVGIRIRNFFRNLPYFSFDLFKSPLELALERLEKAESTLTDVRANATENSSSFVKFFNSTKKYARQAFIASKETNDELAKALIGYTDKKLSDIVHKEICDYINIMKLQKQDPDNTTAATATDSWKKVRAAIDQSSTVNELELENILFKIKLLYPKTRDYDDIVDLKSTMSFIDSSLAMLKSLGGQSTAEQSDTPISDQGSRPIFAPNQEDKIRVKINALKEDYKNYSHINALITLLNSLLDKIIDSRPLKTLDKEIDDKFSKVTIKLHMSTKVPKENQIKELKKLKSTINQIKQDIYSLKPNIEQNKASSSTLKRR